MPDGAHSKVKLNVRVPPHKKEEWKNALDEGETLTSLVQRAVDREIRDEYIHLQAVEDINNETGEIDLSPVNDQLGELTQVVTAIERKIDTIAVTTAGEEDEETIEELAMDVLPKVPSYPNDIPENVLEDVEGMGGMDAQEYIEFVVNGTKEIPEFSIDGSAQRLSTEMREPEHKVRDALRYLEQETTETVHSGIVDSVRHWMRF